ncbi:MAG: hypothetical protein U5L08_11410 [Xanthomonadales bacterium]|nr:hypothetical protein [Xanthomonadales bacterium]
MNTRLHLIRAVLAAVALALSPTLAALSPPPPLPVEVLEDFYEAMNGDDWHRNDGWLDSEVDVCDWYGISCVTEGEEFGGYEWIGRIELQDNNLQGQLTAELQERMWTYGPTSTPSIELDLSGNAIRGEFTYFPWGTEDVNLNGNLLSGTLPEVPEELPENGLVRLRLARNNFEGAVPASWEHLQLRRLELSDNRLDTGVDNAIAAIHGFDHSYLYLNGNRFSAELGQAITQARGLVERGQSNVGAGIDLCYNDFIVDDPDVRDWIAARHVGSSDFEACLGRERVAIDATVSGSWYHPARAGEGVSVTLLDNGAPLIYSFGFDTAGRQQWLFELGTAGDRWMRWDPMRLTNGYFGEGIATDGDDRAIGITGRFRADRLGPDALSLHRHYLDILACGFGSDPDSGPSLCPPPLIDDRLDYQRLSRLAGTTCDNGSDYQQYSGAWYNPEQSGEGFLIEVMPDDRVVVYWFTYKPDDSGEQAWMVGSGTMASVQPVIPTLPQPNKDQVTVTLFQPQSATYGPDFDPADVELAEWGELTIDFGEPGVAEARFESHLDDYGSGAFPIERLARPMLADCDTGNSQN